jgi:hypothetical protein
MLTSNPTRPSTRSTLPNHVLIDGCDDARVAELLAILRVGFPNVLLIGEDADLEAVFQRIQPHLRTAIARWVPEITSNVPTAPFSTLLVKDVRHLDAGQQACLAALIAGVPDVQIVSMAGAPVFPLTDTGAFLKNLYYGLNVVTLNLTERRTVSAVRD